MTVPEISFQDYLEAKAEVDDAALSSVVRRGLLTAVRNVVTEQPGLLRVLDLGTGSGVMVRRLLRDLGVVRSAGTALEICGVDLDAELIQAAGQLCPEGGDQPESGPESRPETGPESGPSSGPASRPETGPESGPSAGSGSVKVEFRVMSVEEALSDASSRELITAHALMDLLPLSATCTAVHNSLVPGGLFYSTINYNGLTRWYPQAEDAEFEQQLLSYYDRSMRRVRSDGCVQDGAASGGRLYEACSAAGLETLAIGGSDWCVFPKTEVDLGAGGRNADDTAGDPNADDRAASGVPAAAYTQGELRLLTWMLRNIYNEGVQKFASKPMDSWMRDRLDCLQHAKLAMVVHHLDLLARRKPE